jgi:hypothetical protein
MTEHDSSLLLQQMKDGKYGFIDAGASTGGSLHFCQKTFKRGPGIGLDRDPDKVEQARAKGLAVARYDLCDPRFPRDCVSFSSMMDFLEHLPDEEVAEKVLVALEGAARDFLFIRHPSFEDIDYLKGLGLKIGWTDWSGHPNRMRVDAFRAIFERLGWNEYVIIAQEPIPDSSHSAIVAADGPRNVVRYDESVHGPKPEVTFDRPVYSRFDILVRCRGSLTDKEWRGLSKKLLSKQSVIL